MFSGRGTLRNTSFALMDPDGNKLTRGSRSPKMTYGSPEEFADALVRTAKRYQQTKAIKALPTIRDLRLALNVAAADMRPLIVIRGKGAKAAARLARKVAKAAWSKDLIGSCHYVVLEGKTTFEKLTPAIGVSFVKPDPYGLGGEVIAHLSATTSESSLRKALVKEVERYEIASRGHRDHIREARRKGISWKPAVPVTDPGGRRHR